MPQATFVLKEPTSKEETLVYLLYRFNGSKLKYSTGQKIKPRYWNPVTQRAREVRGFGYSEFNTLLNNLEAEVNEAYRKLINDRKVPTPDLLRVPLNIFLQKDNSASSKDLISFAEYIVENTDRSKGTKKQLRQAIRNLQEFKQASKRSMHFDSIDLEFYDEFVDFLTKKNYGKNTIGTLIKNLKVFMNEAVDRKLTSNLQFKNKRFRTVEEPTETIYLNEKEIGKLYALDLADNSRLEKVRDLFIIACYTGLRFSDLIELRNENIINNGSVVRIRTQKTGEVVIIPLKGKVKEILQKYDGIPPHAISNQKMNEYLKELGEMAELKEDVVISLTKGGARQTETFKKFELITTFNDNDFIDCSFVKCERVTESRFEGNAFSNLNFTNCDFSSTSFYVHFFAIDEGLDDLLIFRACSFIVCFFDRFDFMRIRFISSNFSECCLSYCKNVELAFDNTNSCDDINYNSIDLFSILESGTIELPVLKDVFGIHNAEVKAYIKELVGEVKFSSVFISYSFEDRVFVKALNNELLSRGVITFLWEKDAPGGKRLKQIMASYIKKFDRVLFIASSNSLKSEACHFELSEGRKKFEKTWEEVLFPIHIDNYLFAIQHYDIPRSKRDLFWDNILELQEINSLDFSGIDERNIHDFKSKIDNLVSSLRKQHKGF